MMKSLDVQGPAVQSLISTYPGLTLTKTYRVNLGLVLIGLSLSDQNNQALNLALLNQ